MTGSAHCALTPYWAAQLHPTSSSSSSEQGQSTSTPMLAYQASARGGVVQVTLQGDRVLLAGPCITTMRTKVVV